MWLCQLANRFGLSLTPGVNRASRLPCWLPFKTCGAALLRAFVRPFLAVSCALSVNFLVSTYINKKRALLTHEVKDYSQIIFYTETPKLLELT